VSTGQVTDWPLIGRDEELDLLRRLRRSLPARSAVISGPAGVGKSTLAAAALAESARDGWATLLVRGSPGYAVVPFGPLRTVLQIPVPKDLTQLTASLEQELLDMRTPTGLFLVVDDAQHLDDESAGLFHQLIASGALTAIFTSRNGSVVHPALTDLWKDGLAERVELQNLSRLESIELLTGMLGGSVEDSTAGRIWRVTEGNPLSSRELVYASRETGSLREVDGVWRLRGGWASGSRLQEIVAARLGRLSPDESTVVELLAVGGTLPLDLVTRLADTTAVGGLEHRGLIASRHSGRRLEVTIAHPLHAEVLRSALPALRQRAIRQNLVRALRATPARRAEDKVRLACWSIESGLEVDPATLSLVSDASLFWFGQSISSRLGEIMPAHTSARNTSAPAVPQDPGLAVRLAEAAFERSGTMADGFALVEALGWVGQTAQAQAVLAQLAERVGNADDRLRLAASVGWVRFWCEFDVDGARDVLTEALRTAPAHCDATLLAEIHQELAGIALNTARPAVALCHAEDAAAAEGVALAESNSAQPAAASLTYLGRCGESLSLIERALPLAHAEGHRFGVANLMFTRAGTLSRRGEVEEARKIAEWLRDVSLSGEHLHATAVFGMQLGEILMVQGQPASAARLFRDSSGLFAEYDVFGYRPWALSGLARARARLGQSEEATAALNEARSLRHLERQFELSLFRAQIEVNRLIGNEREAEAAAREGVAWARAAGMAIDEAYALDACIRCRPSEPDAVRLTELESTVDSRLVSALARRARALVDGDPEELLESSGEFAAMTVWWEAADSAAEAARILERRHHERAARAAVRLSAEHGARCEGYRPPAGRGDMSAARLTPRESEVASLAAAGRSNREIADQMHLSLRTVENHLQRAFVKLGVNDRSALSKTLGASHS
jgi:DNA-binding NarL/FixJ family response regulator